MDVAWILPVWGCSLCGVVWHRTLRVKSLNSMYTSSFSGSCDPLNHKVRTYRMNYTLSMKKNVALVVRSSYIDWCSVHAQSYKGTQTYPRRENTTKERSWWNGYWRLILHISWWGSTLALFHHVIPRTRPRRRLTLCWSIWQLRHHGYCHHILWTFLPTEEIFPIIHQNSNMYKGTLHNLPHSWMNSVPAVTNRICVNHFLSKTHLIPFLWFLNLNQASFLVNHTQ